MRRPQKSLCLAVRPSVPLSCLRLLRCSELILRPRKFGHKGARVLIAVRRRHLVFACADRTTEYDFVVMMNDTDIRKRQFLGMVLCRHGLLL